MRQRWRSIIISKVKWNEQANKQAMPSGLLRSRLRNDLRTIAVLLGGASEPRDMEAGTYDNVGVLAVGVVHHALHEAKVDQLADEAERAQSSSAIETRS